MKNYQRGFFSSSILVYSLLGAMLTIAGLSIALKVQTSNLEDSKQEYSELSARVEAANKLAVAESKRKVAEDQLNKEKADHENVITRTKLVDLSKQLRNERARSRSGLVPAPAAGSQSADRICYKRADFDRAISDFVDKAGELSAGFAEQGAQGIADLNTVKVWAGNFKGK